ncbi:MAG: hypothetical protein QME14_03330 [Methanobacteriaceae archaeon]|nr:hypothetical protein [Methanobacteriaceae archaeon]
MDEKGLIFTTDAVLAVSIFIVISAALMTYYVVPNFAGQDQQRLETIAADALRVMQYDGTLYTAAVYYQAGNTTQAENLISSSLNYLIPSNIGYRLTLSNFPSVENNRGLFVANDVASRVEVISGPREGWMGRAWYKVEKAEFEDQQANVTTTLWNFHNWLTNFEPWRSYGLYSRPFWGGGSSAQNIAFSIPQGSTITGGYFLIGSSAESNLASFGARTNINGNNYMANPNQFTFLNRRPSTTTRMYNYQGIINPAHLAPGINNYYVNFLNMSSGSSLTRYNLPWFSIIGNYTTTFRVPKGILNERFDFNDSAGLAVPDPQDLSGDGQANEYGRIYDLDTATVTSFTNRRVMNWNTFVNNRNELDNFDDGTPFVITNLPGVSGTGHGSAVSIIQEFDLPSDNIRVLDAAVYMNIYGGTDNAMVEVWDGTRWQTVFCSFNFDGGTYSARSDGYGNIPGTLYIGNRLKAGHNRVRITIWDQVPSNDYDFVGLVDCYTTVSYTRLPIRWENFPYNSYQANTNTQTQDRSFTIEEGAKEVYLFLGPGVDTRSLRVQVRQGTNWRDLYPTSSTIPYYLNLASIDAGGNKVFTNGTSGNYTLKPGTYLLRTIVTGPTNYWESGDYNGNAEIFSGTRIAVLYPEFLANLWATSYANDAATAQQNALNNLTQALIESGYTVDPNLLRSEALYTGDLPNNLPVRLDLWRQ